MKIEVFEITSKEDKVYLELLEQYRTNPEVQELMDETIISGKIIIFGDFRLVTMFNYAIEIESIRVYLVKNVDKNIFLWAIGKHVEDGKLSMHPLLKKQSKKLQLAIRKTLIEKGLMVEKKIK